MTKIICTVSLLLTLMLCACSTLHAPTAPQQPMRIGLQLSPASFGQSISLQQHLTVDHQGRTDTLDVALEITPQALNLVGLAFDQRVMTLHYDNKGLQVWRNPYLPKQIQGKDVLEDLQLSLWPEAAIRKALPAGWQINDHDNLRTISFNNMAVMEINYSGKPRWAGKIVLTNLHYHYRLTIQSVEANN